MYIKVMQQFGEQYKEQMYECTNYTYIENEDTTLLSIIHDDDNITSIDLDRDPTTKVFVMNDNGVTIDSYKWTEEGYLK